MGPAGVVDGDAESVVVEDPSLRAGIAGAGGQVPVGTSSVSRGLGVGGRVDATTFDQVVTLVAGQADSVGIMSPAGIADRGADSIVVEDPSGRTLKAHSGFPGLASRVRGTHNG